MQCKWICCVMLCVMLGGGGLKGEAMAQAVGHTPGEFSVDATGAATYRIPLQVPPGAAGMQPDLALLYHARAGNGHLGVGWSLSGLSAISRCPVPRDAEGESRAGSVTLSAADRFCLDGQLLRSQQGTAYGANNTRYLTEIQSFQDVTSHGQASGAPTHFTVTDRAGLKRFYGETTDSRILSVGVLAGVPVVWAVNRIEDRHGNFIAFSYGRDAVQGEYWPSEIRWGNRLGHVLGRVVLGYDSTRPDKSFGHGFGRTRQSLVRRLSHLQVYEGSSVATRRYVLAYVQGEHSGLSHLASVRECAGLGSPCLAPTMFEWEPGRTGFELGAARKVADNAAGMHWLDVDGDGRMDAVLRVNGSIRIQFGGEPAQTVITNVPAGSHLRFNDAVVLDYDGDGRMDLLVANTQTGHWDVYRSTGSGFSYLQTGRPHFDAHTRHPVALDITGNGIPELFFKRLGRLHVYLGTDQAGFHPVAVDTGWVVADGQRLLPLQFDGDGRPELLVSQDGCSGVTAPDDGGGGGEHPILPVGGPPPEQGMVELVAMPVEGDLQPLSPSGSGGSCNSSVGPLKWDPVARTLHRPWAIVGHISLHDPMALDIDGDGLADIVAVDVSSRQLIVLRNRGGHFEHVWSGLSNADRTRAQVVDWNQDGRDDLLVRSADGRLRVLTYRHNIFEVIDAGASVAEGAHFFADWDGDGLPDLYVLNSGAWRVRRHLGRPAGQLQGLRDGLGASLVVNHAALSAGQGGNDPVYLGSEAGGATVATPRIRHYLGALQVVESYMADAGVRSPSGYPETIVTRMRYGGAKLNQHGRGFIGFRRILAHNVNAGVVTENLHFQEFPFTGMIEQATQRMPDSTALVEPDWLAWQAWFAEHCAGWQVDACSPPPMSVTTPGPVVQQVHNTVASMAMGGTGQSRVHFPYVQNSVEIQRELSTGQVVRRTSIAYTYNHDGNATQVSVTTDNGAGGDVHTVNTVNSWNHSEACPSRLIQSVVTQAVPAASSHGPASRQRTATFQYHPVHCQLSQEVSDAGTGAALTTTYAYDTFGNRTQATITGSGLAPRTTATAWDAQGRFPVSVTNALGHAASSTWDARFGRRLTATDANGLVVSWQYDAFGRETKATGPRSTQHVSTSRTWCGSSGCQHPEAVLKITRTGAGSAVEQSLSVTELDRLGREVAVGDRNVLGQMVYALTYFDAAGRPYASSGPYRPGFDTGACWTLRHYDPLGRVRNEYASAQPGHCGALVPPAPSAAPAGWSMTQTSYAGLTTTVIDPEGRQRQRIVNVMDRLRFVREHDGSAWQQTEYRYDGHGNTTWVQAPGGVLTTSTYDDAGRKIAMSDPSMGSWSYAYNAAGELTSQTDANGITVTMTYDALGRLLTRVEPEGTTTWTYDQLAHGAARGQVTNIAGPHGYVERFWYQGAGGELSASARYIGDTWFWTHLDYNGLGQISQVRYPSVNCAAPCSSVPPDAGRLRVEQGYRYGHLVQVRERRPDGTVGTVYWEALEVDALGAVTRARLGNGLETLRYVNPATGLVESIVTGGAGNPTSVQDLGMAWDRVGNLVQRADYRVNRREDLAYDGLGRLTSVTLRTGAGGLLGTESLAYAPSGNLLAKGSYTNYQYAISGRPHRVSAVTTPSGARGYLYDANGNLTQVTGPGARTMSWWSFNKPRRMERDANNHAEYWYGPGGDRAMFRQSARVNGQLELTLYGSTLYERRHIGATIEHTHYVQANGGTVATVRRIPTPTTTITMTRYLHKDHLGSVVAITSESGAVVESLAYDAWGKRRPATTWQTPGPSVFIAAITLTRGFTMHEHLDQVGLIHMGGRVYDPELGRFLSPDPFVQFPASTQGFNRYAYVGNNPLSYTDPSGYFLKKALRIGLTIAAAYYTGGAAAKLWGDAAGAMIGGAVGGYLNTGSVQGAALGAVSGGVAYGVGGAFGHNIGYDQLGQMATKAVAHGVTQGLIARAGGGRFGDGALGGMASTFGSPAVAKAGSGVRQAMAAAALGGTVSVIGGGKFANGAIAAAWVNLFNDQADRMAQRRAAREQAEALNRSGGGSLSWVVVETKEGWTVQPAEVRALEVALGADMAKSVFMSSSPTACSIFCSAAVAITTPMFGDYSAHPASHTLNDSGRLALAADQTLRVVGHHPNESVGAFSRSLRHAPWIISRTLWLPAAVNNFGSCYRECRMDYIQRK